MPVIGIQELVNAAEGIVVVAVAPHGVVQQAQKLQRLEKRPGRVGRDPGEHVGDGLVADTDGLLPVAGGEGRDEVQHVQHGLQKFLLLRRLGGFQLRADLFRLFGKAVGHQHAVIRAHVEHAAVFVEGVGLVQLPVLFFGVDLRDGAHGAQQRDALVGEDDRRLLREDIAQPSDGALHVVEPLRGELPGQRVRVFRGLAVGVVRFVTDKEVQLLLNMFGFHKSPSCVIQSA